MSFSENKVDIALELILKGSLDNPSNGSTFDSDKNTTGSSTGSCLIARILLSVSSSVFVRSAFTGTCSFIVNGLCFFRFTRFLCFVVPDDVDEDDDDDINEFDVELEESDDELDEVDESEELPELSSSPDEYEVFSIGDNLCFPSFRGDALTCELLVGIDFLGGDVSGVRPRSSIHSSLFVSVISTLFLMSTFFSNDASGTGAVGSSTTTLNMNCSYSS